MICREGGSCEGYKASTKGKSLWTSGLSELLWAGICGVGSRVSEWEFDTKILVKCVWWVWVKRGEIVLDEGKVFAGQELVRESPLIE